MKKKFLLAGIIASIALSLGSFMSCSSEAGPQRGSSSTTYKATIDNIEVFASYNGSEKSFRGTVSDSSITIDLPANIDSWTDSWICIYLDYGKSIQLNGTGTPYSGSSSEKITGVTLSSLNSILVKGSGYEDQSYTVKINKKLYDKVCNLMNTAGATNKMFVKNELMPHKIRIIAVKKCRLQDLTNEECTKEGVRKGSIYGYLCGKGKTQKKFLTAKAAFYYLIDKLNGKNYWESNPEGYAYEFELVK